MASNYCVLCKRASALQLDQNNVCPFCKKRNGLTDAVTLHGKLMKIEKIAVSLNTLAKQKGSEKVEKMASEILLIINAERIL